MRPESSTLREATNMSGMTKLLALSVVAVLALSAAGIVDRSLVQTLGDFLVRSLDTLFLKLTVA